MNFLLAQVCRLHHARVHQLLDALGLYRGQPQVLFRLWEREGQTHRDLAASMQVTPATITRMIQRMEKTGFVQRRPDPGDQRISRVYLTDAGRGVQAQVEAIWEQMEQEVFAGFTPDEQATLRSHLQRIRANLTQAVGS